MTHPTPPYPPSEFPESPESLGSGPAGFEPSGSEYPVSADPETIAGAMSQPEGNPDQNQPVTPSPDYRDRVSNAFSANFPQNPPYSSSQPPQSTQFHPCDRPPAPPPAGHPPGTFQPIGPRDRSVPPPPDLYRHRHGYPPQSPQFSQPSPHLPPQPYPTPAPYPEAYPAAAPAYAAEYAPFQAHAADRPAAGPSAFPGGNVRSMGLRDRRPPNRKLVISIPTALFYPWPVWGIFAMMLGGILLLLGPDRVFSSAVHKSNEHCQEVIQPQAVISRTQLAQILTVPERDPKQRIQSIIAEPYCILPSVQIRAGTLALREAYPLEFDPETWLIILYEGDEYAGYRFLYR